MQRNYSLKSNQEYQPLLLVGHVMTTIVIYVQLDVHAETITNTHGMLFISNIAF